MDHHAYIYEGTLSQLGALAADARERFSFGGAHDPDVHVREIEKFGIDDARWLADAAALKSAGGRALFIVGVSSITIEAQQALLKLLEEPQEGTVIVLLAPHGAFLPTIRSRALAYPQQLEHLQQSSVKKFLAMPGKERSDYVAQLLKDDEGVKDRVRDFINALEAELAKKIADPKARLALADVAMAREYLGDRSASLKMLLEHLAIALPQP